MQLHEKNLLGLWMSPGQHGQMICSRYWEKGKSCPVIATFGQDPLTLMAASAKIPWGRSELEFVGGLRGKPLDIVTARAPDYPSRPMQRSQSKGKSLRPARKHVMKGLSENGPATIREEPLERERRSRLSASKQFITETIRSWKTRRRFGRAP